MTQLIINCAPEEVRGKDAYERVKEDWATLDASRLRQVNLDIPTATRTILGALPALQALREQLTQELPSFDLQQLDDLEDGVVALLYVQARYVMATRPADDLVALYDSARGLRRRLRLDAKALAERGLFDARKLEALTGRTGHINVGLDLQSLSHELEAVWPQISDHCAIRREELEAATQMGTRLLRVVGVRKQPSAALKSLAEERQRGFTVVIQAWEAMRAAVRYLRRAQRDAHRLAPNLYTGKPRRAKPSAPEPVESAPTEADTPVADVIPNAAPEPLG